MTADSQTFVEPTDEALEDAFTDVYDDGSECADCPNKMSWTEPHGECTRGCSLIHSQLVVSGIVRYPRLDDCPGVRKILELD